MVSCRTKPVHPTDRRVTAALRSAQAALAAHGGIGGKRDRRCMGRAIWMESQAGLDGNHNRQL